MIVIVLISTVGNGIVCAASSQLSIQSSGIATTSTPASTVTPTPGVQAGAEPQAWIDGAIDLDQFPPGGAMVIHFNTPMTPEKINAI